MSRTQKQQNNTQPAPVRKYRVVAACDACDEAAARLDVVLQMLKFLQHDESGYALTMITDALATIREKCLEGSEEYTKAIEAEEDDARRAPKAVV